MERIRKITITIRDSPNKTSKNVNDELLWLSDVLGLFDSKRDREKSKFRLFVELIKAKKEREFLSSDELAERARLSRGTIIHHIHDLEDRGFIIHKNKKYQLSRRNIELLIRDIKREFDDFYDDINDMARRVDRELEL
ncbi:hypothetical protein CL617_01795 [archaeon]|nr:hypothetical protein [archaeon]|tara:strand:- start:16314 stop:16727 length:414 start_codon:yes stop_codon:yes gene_type:complete